MARSRTEPRYDIIIAGTGAAGLTLLHHLLESGPPDLSILLLDRTLEPRNDRTWCFWSRTEPWMGSLCHVWPTLMARSQGNEYEKSLNDYRYYCLPGLAFTETMLSRAREHERVTLMETDILDFGRGKSERFARVITSDGDLQARWIFQSVTSPSSPDTRVDNELLQHFTGWEVQTARPVFDTGRVVWMDFDVEQIDGELTFFYLLPFARDRALVEHTLFSPAVLRSEVYQKAIRRYLADRYRILENDYSVLRSEAGTIPMTDRTLPSRMHARIVNIGQTGGVTKASTGYTFIRINDHGRQIAAALQRGETPPDWPGSSYRFRVYDMLLLYLLKHESGVAKEVFHRLFDRNDMEEILRFLAEESRPGGEIALFSTMPRLPFLRAIWNMSHRIVTGA